MASTVALLGLSLFTTLVSQQPAAVARSPLIGRQFQLDCQVVLHRANGQPKLLADPHLCSLEGKPAQFVSGGETAAGIPFGTLFSFLATRIDPYQVRLQAEVELSKHVGAGVVETVVRFHCDKVVEPGKAIRLKKKDLRNPEQFYRATFRLTEVKPAVPVNGRPAVPEAIGPPSG